MKKLIQIIGVVLALIFPSLMNGQVYTQDFTGGIPGNWITYSESGVDFIYENSGIANLFKQSQGDEILILGTEELDLSSYTKMEADLRGLNFSFSTTRPYCHIGILWDQNDVSSFEAIKIIHLTNPATEMHDIFLGAYSGMGHVAFKLVGEKSHLIEVDNFKLYDDDFEANFPLAVDIISAVPASAGGLSITIDWTNPTLEADGDMLQSLDSVVFYVGDVPLHTHLNPVVGANESAMVPVDSSDYYKINVIPFSDGNAGYERETDVYWVGLDYPSVVHDLVIEINGDQVTLSWTPPTEGGNGGYYDGVVEEYYITRSDGNFTSTPGTQNSFTETLDAMGTINYIVQARNSSDAGDPLTSDKVYYVSDDFLYYEDFWLDVVQSPTDPVATENYQWQSETVASGAIWTFYDNDFTGTDPGELAFTKAFQNPGTTETVRGISPIINTSGLENITIQLNTYVVANNNSFSFLVETTSDGGQNWTQVHEWQISTENLSEAFSKVIANDDVGSETFQFAISFFGNPSYPDFVARFDNIRVISQPSTDVLVESFGQLGTVVPTTVIPLIADIENNSTSMVDCSVKCTVKERFGAGVPFEMELDALNMAIGEIRTMDFGTWEAEEGEYLVEMEVIYPGGDDEPENDLAVRELNVLYLGDRNLVLMEDFTGTWCTYCPGAALGIADLFADGYPIAAIGLHRQDPYETPDVQDKMDQYGVEGFPTMLIDGVVKLSGGHQTQSVAYLYIPHINDRSAIQTTAQIEIIHSVLDGDTYNAIADISSLSIIQNPNYKLRASIIESEIEDEWLGLPTVDEAQRYYSQHDIDLSDKNDQVNISFQIDNFVNTDHAEMVVYVQDTSTNEVLNVATIDLNTTIVSTFNNEFEGTFEIFPNPATEQLTIQLEDVNFNGDTSLRIMNSFGQTVFEKLDHINGQFDLMNVNLSSLNSGIYIINLNLGDKKVFSEKIVVIR